MTAMATEGKMHLLTFRLDRETFAVDVLKTREILDYTPPTRVPQTPPFMLGVINLRGSVVPVIDLRRKFGLAAAAQTTDSCIIVLEVTLEGEPAVVGALADSVREVLELEPDQVEPPPRIGMRLHAEYLRGMGKQGEDFLIILDTDRVFSGEEVALYRETAVA